MKGWVARKYPDLQQQQNVGKIAKLQHVVVPVLCLVQIETGAVQHHCLDCVVFVKRLWRGSQPVSTQTARQEHDIVAVELQICTHLDEELHANEPARAVVL